MCWPHYTSAPKPLALLQALNRGCREFEKAPFHLQALQPFAGSLRRGQAGVGETFLHSIMLARAYSTQCLVPHLLLGHSEHQQGPKALREHSMGTEPRQPDPQPNRS